MRLERPGWLGIVVLCGYLLCAPPVAAAAGRSVGEVFQPGEELVWAVEAGGKRIGHNWSRYEGVVDVAGLRAHLFRSRVRLESEVPGGRLVQRFTHELWTDDAGRPLRASLRAALGDAVSGVDATFAADTVSTKIRQGATEQRHDAPYQAGAFVLANNFVSHLDLAIALAAPPVDRPSAIPLFSVNVLQPFPLQLEPLAIDASTGRGTFRNSLGEVLYLDTAGRLERVELPAQQLEFRRVPITSSWSSPSSITS